VALGAFARVDLASGRDLVGLRCGGSRGAAIAAIVSAAATSEEKKREPSAGESAEMAPALGRALRGGGQG
jgi:hypothetical protein